MDREAAKRRAAAAAVEEVDDGDVVGLGSGSTAGAAIRELGQRVDEGLDVRGVPTSMQAREVALEAGVPVVDLDQVSGVDVAIDGADQAVLGLGEESTDGDSEDQTDVLVKGGGGAHAREKLVDTAAERLLVVVDATKLADAVDHPVPVEVLPAARTVVAERIEELGGEPSLRRAAEKSGPVVSDNGNLILDCAFGGIEDPASISSALDGLPGVLEHGLFVGTADAVYVGEADGVERLVP